METKRILTRTRKTQESMCPFISHPAERNERWNHHWNKPVFFPNKYSYSAGLAINSFTLLNTRIISIPSCIFSTALATWDTFLLWGYLVVNGHLLKLLLSQASNTMYFCIALPKKKKKRLNQVLEVLIAPRPFQWAELGNIYTSVYVHL